MGGDSSYLAILRIAGFLTAAWVATKISNLVGVSSIVAEITTGIVLGPELLGLIPKEYAECEHGRYTSCAEPEGFDDGYGQLTADLAAIASDTVCDKAAYKAAAEHKHYPAGSTEALDVNFTIAGIMYYKLEEDPTLKAAVISAIREWLSAKYAGVSAGHRRLSPQVHSADPQSTARTESAPEHSSDTSSSGEHTHAPGATVMLSDYNGYPFFQATITVLMDQAEEAKSKLFDHVSISTPPHDEDHYFQKSLARVVKDVAYIALAADVDTITVINIEMPWVTTISEPANFTELWGFIELRGSTSLYWQAGGEKHFIPQDGHDRYPHDKTYLSDCYDDTHHTLEADEFFAIPMGRQWWGCGMCENDCLRKPTLTPTTTTVSVTSFTTELQQRRLAGGGHGELQYSSYGECLRKECEIHKQSACQLTPDVFTLVGHTGVAMMIFESGMHFDFKMARVVGPWACVVAVLGTILPLVTGALLTTLYGYPLMPDGLTAGTALAPTSVGISLRLLGQAGVLNQEFGQTIMTAAFVDDILSLVLFNVMFAMGHGEITFMGTFFWSIIGIVFMMFAVALAVFFWPWVLKDFALPYAEKLKNWLSPKDPEDAPKISQRDEALFGIMMLLLIAYASFTFICGTHLWGCFIAGMSFACFEPIGHAHHVWVKQTKRITSWMIRIFFCCTVAFAIPVTELFKPVAIWKGSIMGIGPCILTKVCCAFFMGPPKFVIGWAMVGRAEFAYLIAQMGAASNMIDQSVFSILIWALLWATIFAPLIFGWVLARYIKDEGITPLARGHDGHDGHAASGGAAAGDEEAAHISAFGKLGNTPEARAVPVATVVRKDPWEDDITTKAPGRPPRDSESCCWTFKKGLL